MFSKGRYIYLMHLLFVLILQLGCCLLVFLKLVRNHFNQLSQKYRSQIPHV